jgi:hypothetical protein
MNPAAFSEMVTDVTPQIQKHLLETAKKLQTACNHQDTSDTVTQEINALLQQLVENGVDMAGEVGENNLSNDQGLKLIQSLALNRDAVEVLLHEKRFVAPDVVARFDALVRASDPFKASISRSVLSRSGSTGMVTFAKNEKEFLATNGLSEEFLADYFAADSPTGIEVVLKVAMLTSDPKFGVPQKKDVVVGRDLVDWLEEVLKLGDRTKGVKMGQDLLTHELLVPRDREKKVSPFVDGDKFYVFARDRIGQVKVLVEAKDDDTNERCEQCGRQGRRVGSWCSICGYEPPDNSPK